MRTAVVEGYSRSGDEVLDRGGDEELAWSCDSGDPGTHMNGDAAHSAVQYLALARMDPRSDTYAELADAFDDVACACHRSRWTLEGRKEAVTRRIDLEAAEAVKFFADDRMVMNKELPPRTIANRDGSLGGSDDVGEENRPQFPDESTTLCVITLEKSLVHGLCGRPWHRTEFLAQKAAQLLVRQQGLGDVALNREHLHQESVAAFSVRSEFDQRSCRALGGCEFRSRKTESNRSETLVRSHQNII